MKEMGHEPIVFVGSTINERIIHQGIEVQRVSFKINWFYKLLDKLSRFQYQTLLNVLWESYYLRRKIIAIHKQEKIDLILFTSFKSLGILRARKIRSLMI